MGYNPLKEILYRLLFSADEIHKPTTCQLISIIQNHKERSEFVENLENT